ncbi:MAG: site-specific DNA-methyltransferase [Oscillospiraceae bacterium]|jgi:adenine-specific DNA-methyltransferase|nr:site-specific DNA-methyltransferase [Oscillospiraceae bacterium]
MNNILDGMSFDLERTNLEKLASVFPEVIVEGQLDLTKLLDLLGKYDIKDFEKYSFTWKGKSECLPLAQKRSTGTLRPKPNESVNFDETNNIYIKGDNLEVLKLLQTAYYRQVKMIYIDPPYNTGNDFVYADDFADPMAKYKEVTQQTTKSNPETMGRFHTNWLNMMYPRLRLAANLLRDDGVIFISIDDHEVHNLRKLCDEVFGEENFVTQIVWERAFAPINLMKQFSPSHDFVIVYAKRLDELICNGIQRTDIADSRYSNPDNDPRGVWSSSDISVGPAIEANIYPITTPSGRVVEPPAGRSWRLSKNAFFERLQDNRIWFGEDGNGVPRIKRFKSDLRKSGMTPMTIWKHIDVGHSQSATKALKELFDGKMFFDYPKPVSLIKRMLELYTQDNDIILDFFSGSGTTAHAVMQLNAEDGGNRRFILVQLPEVTDEKSEAYKAGYKNICEIGTERIRRTGKKLTETDKQMMLGDENKKDLDVGFKVFELDTSNLKSWDGTPVDEEEQTLLIERMHNMIDNVKPDRTDMDMVYEIMLKMGVPLTYTITPLDINDKIAYSIGEECLLLICLAEGITPENIEKMCDYTPGKIIFSRRCMKDDTTMANAHYILQDRHIGMKLV